MSRIAVIGHFMDNTGETSVNGQTVKTYNIYKMLTERYGNVYRLDTNNFGKRIIKNYLMLISLCFKCQYLIILPTYKGLIAITPLLFLFKPICRYKVIYPVVGGWLPRKLDNNRMLNRLIKCIDYILPESEKMVADLKKLGHRNVKKMANFSTRRNIGHINNEIKGKKYKFCTFSRVTKEKGISDAIEAIEEVSMNMPDEQNILLDIYGPIDSKYKGEFEAKIKNTKANVQYKGILKPDEIIPTLSKYYCMLFPTYYPGEGMPGAVLEAFAAGLPVIATDWHDNPEIIMHDYNGLIYPTGDQNEFVKSIYFVIKNPVLVEKMAKRCYEASRSYLPENVMKIIFNYIDSEDSK